MAKKPAKDKDHLSLKRKSGWEILKGKEKAIDDYCSEYLSFITEAKTEREAVSAIKQKIADRTDIIAVENRLRAIALCRKGKAPLSEGLRIVVAHLDAPRLDLKANPLYEDIELAMLKTHYYGGIKKYQWLARPLAIHGVVIRADGKPINITMGENESEPCFTIEDLLPHLADKVQASKNVKDAFQGEKLNIIFGSKPDLNVKEEKVKKNILALLNKKYGITEEDFVSADLQIVPSGPAREIGIDASMLGGYGHDDRICAWAALKAIMSAKDLPYTTIALLVDKEEIGSEGNTGAKSMFVEEVVWEIAEKFNQKIFPSKVLYRSKAISGDVNGALDPDYPEVHEKTNAAKLGYGVCVTKFTGARGKSGASEASAEYIGWIRTMLNKKKIPWQTGELGKVDEGGGGTVAKYLAEYGMDIVDMGPALLSMHAPFEIASKVDAYSTYLSYLAFMEEK
jgi:aspartyl aminopeptidase